MTPSAPARGAAGLLQCTRSFSRRRVLVVGDLVADHYIYGQTERVSREAPVLIVRFEDSEVKLGGAANAAANVRALGARVTAVGLLGADEMGSALRREFRDASIELEAVSGRGVHTESKTRILAGGVNTTRQQMLRLDRTTRGPLAPKLRKQVASTLLAAASEADAVLVSDYGAGTLSDEVRAVLRQLVEEKVPVCVDSRYALGAFAGMTLAKPNEPELEALTGLPVRTDAELLRAGQRAIDLLRCRALLVTRGRHGMALFDRDQPPAFIPVHGAAEAVDVTGAGDTVIATCALALAAGVSLLEAARLANVAGSLVVQKQGTATVSIHELRAELGRAR